MNRKVEDVGRSLTKMGTEMPMVHNQVRMNVAVVMVMAVVVGMGMVVVVVWEVFVVVTMVNQPQSLDSL